MNRIVSRALVAAVSTASLAEAQSFSFDRLALHLDQGDRITVVAGDGQELQGRIVGLSSSTLSLLTDALRFDLDRDDISVIRRPERDSLATGAAIGFASGAALAVSLFARDGRLHQAGFVLPALLLSGAAGMGTGMGLDALHQESRVIYRAAPSAWRSKVSPVVLPERRALSVSFSF